MHVHAVCSVVWQAAVDLNTPVPVHDRPGAAVGLIHSMHWSGCAMSNPTP